MEMDDVARVAGALAWVRRTVREGLAEWRYHGRLVARQLDGRVPARYVRHMMVVADLADGDAGAIEDALEAAWQLQRSAD